jgi:hypothetical protein
MAFTQHVSHGMCVGEVRKLMSCIDKCAFIISVNYAKIRAAQGEDTKWKTDQARKNLYYMDHVCSASKSFSQKFNYSMQRGAVDPTLLEQARIRDGDDEQSDVARFLRYVRFLNCVRR